MKNKYKIVVVFLLIGITSCYAQLTKLDAHGNIKMLKQGALLVRLKTSDLAITALKKQGNDAEAEEIRKMQETENKIIIDAFKTNFSFCNVYFFYSSNSTEIKNGNCKDVLFDTDFKTISIANCADILIGEFDESETTHIDAFIIKDKNYNQLNSPFPFLIKSTSMLVATRKKEDIIKELNTKLTDFWAKNQ